eukprot:6107699-Heterocapsa_arctica.AAC.1
MGGCCLVLHHRLELFDPVPDLCCLFEDGLVDLVHFDLCHLLVRARDVLDALESLVDLVHRWL